MNALKFSIVAVVVLYGAGEPAPEDTNRFVVICPIDEMVDEGLVVVVERAVRESQGAEALIFDIDTFGGQVDSAIAITEAILKAPCHTIAYARGRGAISAGALIAFACKDIVMSPSTNIGAAQPVIATSEGMLPTGEKEVSFLRSKMAALAEVNGHNPAIAQAMVDKDIELYAARAQDGRVVVWSPAAGNATTPPSGQSQAMKAIQEGIDSIEKQTGVPMAPVRDIVKSIEDQATGKPDEKGETKPKDSAPVQLGSEPTLILAKGKLLTLTAQEARAYGLIRSTATSMEQVLGLYDHHPARQVRIEMTNAERIFRWLTNPMVAGVLLMIALGGLYLEIKTPGFGLPGIVSIIAFALFFGARAVLGMAEWIDLVLVLTGIAFILVEVFVLPGHGILGVAGILCLIAGLYLSFTLNDFNLPEYSWEFDRLREMGITVGIALGTLIAATLLLWRFFPHTPAYSRLVLTEVQEPGRGFVVQTDEQEDKGIGMKGVAESVLRPAGRGRFGGKTYPVVSRSEYIEEGTPIVVVQVEGNRYVVDPVKERKT